MLLLLLLLLLWLFFSVFGGCFPATVICIVGLPFSYTPVSTFRSLPPGLAGEQIRWKLAVERFDAQILALVGDVLLSAGCISYYGPFTGSYREV